MSGAPTSFPHSIVAIPQTRFSAFDVDLYGPSTLLGTTLSLKGRRLDDDVAPHRFEEIGEAGAGRA